MRAEITGRVRGLPVIPVEVGQRLVGGDIKQNAFPRPEMSRAEGVPFIVVGERLRNHIENWAGEWTQFLPAELESS